MPILELMRALVIGELFMPLFFYPDGEMHAGAHTGGTLLCCFLVSRMQWSLEATVSGSLSIHLGLGLGLNLLVGDKIFPSAVTAAKPRESLR